MKCKVRWIYLHESMESSSPPHNNNSSANASTNAQNTAMATTEIQTGGTKSQEYARACVAENQRKEERSIAKKRKLERSAAPTTVSAVLTDEDNDKVSCFTFCVWYFSDLIHLISW